MPIALKAGDKTKVEVSASIEELNKEIALGTIYLVRNYADCDNVYK